MEASAIPASAGLTRTRIALGAPLLRIRSDEQLVSLFRSGNDDAFRVIHDRYRHRLFVYTRQMLGGSGADPEDAVQEIFVRAHAGLLATDRQLALRAWLYRIAHNRCVDELRRPYPQATEAIEATELGSAHDPVARVEQRDVLRRLIEDVQRLPEQQRSALLMRELGGVPYVDISGALAVSVPAVKSLLVRARVGLAQANEARDTACAAIREDLILSHDRGVRTSGLARRHIRDCRSCREFRGEVRGVSRQFAALVPTLGPIGVAAKLLGIGSGGGAAASSVTGGSAAAAGGAAGTGIAASVGAFAGAGHVVTLLAAAVVTAGGAIELQHASPPSVQHTVHHRIVHAPRHASELYSAAPVGQSVAASGSDVYAVAPVTAVASPGSRSSSPSTSSAPRHHASRSRSSTSQQPLLISETADPDNISYSSEDPTSSTGTGTPATPGGTTPTTSAASTAPGSTSGATTSAAPAATGTTTDLAATGTTGPGSSGTTTSTGAAGTSGGASTATSSTGSGGSSTSKSSGTATSRGSSRVSGGSGKAAVFTVTSN